MNDVQPTLGPWQYALVWTPGPERSLVQLWAVSAQGHRNLWDSWEVEGQAVPPTIQRVLYVLYVEALTAQERQTHLP